MIVGTPETAQFTKLGNVSTNAWFGYAPADDPRYAIAVVVEVGKSGAAVSGPIVRQIFETICEYEREKWISNRLHFQPRGFRERGLTFVKTEKIGRP